MYANASLSDPFTEEGAQYGASGGPNWNVIDIWKVAAPHIALEAPDIYDRDQAKYAQAARPLRAGPTIRCSSPRPAMTRRIARFFWLALGKGAIGWAPFGMDATGYSNFPLGAQQLDAETLDAFASKFALLAPIARDWARLAFEHPTAGFAKPQDGADQTAVARPLEDHRACTACGQFGERDWTWIDMPPNPNKDRPVGGAAVIQLGPDEFLVAGSDVRVRFALDTPHRGDNVAVPRRRGRHVRERPLGDGAPLERRPDRLRPQPDRRRPCSRFGWGPTDETADPPVPWLLRQLERRFAQPASSARRPGSLSSCRQAGPERRCGCRSIGDRIIRVTESADRNLETAPSLTVIAQPLSTGFTVAKSDRPITMLSTGKIRRADVDSRPATSAFAAAAGGRVVLAESATASFAPATPKARHCLDPPAVQPRHRRGLLRPRPAPVRADELQRRGRRARPAQHGRRDSVRRLDAQLRPAVGQSVRSPASATRSPTLSRRRRATGCRSTAAAGWTATYTVNGKLLAARQEADDRLSISRKPQATGRPGTRTARPARHRPGLSVTWDRPSVTPRTGGLHRFRLYSSGYAKVFVDGREVLDRWRQNWNPWYHNFDAAARPPGKPVEIRVEWEPDGGYIALEHDDPRPEPDRHSLTFSSELGTRVDYYFVGGDKLDEVIAGYRELTGKARDHAANGRTASGRAASATRPRTSCSACSANIASAAFRSTISSRTGSTGRRTQWGCQCFDPARFPDPKAMVDDVHAQRRAHHDLGLGRNIIKGTANYDELDAVARHLRHVDPRPTSRRTLTTSRHVPRLGRPRLSQRLLRSLQSTARGHLLAAGPARALLRKGFDALWLDSDEPDFHSNLSIDETHGAWVRPPPAPARRCSTLSA